MSRKFAFIAGIFILCNTAVSGQNASKQDDRQPKGPWNHPYHKTLVMKMFLSVPDGKGGSTVVTDFSKALSLIKETDNLTLGVPKIIYLVGWQYHGHDDRYPAFFEVNEALKRPQDRNARESLIWLMNEARKYHTTLSLHINMTDAYDDSPLWNTYVANDLISKNADGSLMVIGNYNQRKAYQINYKQEWEKGFAQKRINQLLELLPPLKQAGTIHIDAWIVRESKGHNESMIMEADYQRKICRYWMSQGIDVTSEWVMDYMTGLIPHYWHFNGRTQQDYLNTPASLCTGSRMNPDLRQSDFALEFLFGTSMYGENLYPDPRKHITDDSWQESFSREFFLNFLQYYYLNHLSRLGVEGEQKNRVAYFSNQVTVSLADSTVRQGNLLLRSGNTVCFPAQWRKDNSLAAFSTTGKLLEYRLPDSWGQIKRATVFLVQKNGLEKREEVFIENNMLKFPLPANMPLLIVPQPVKPNAVQHKSQ